MRPIDEVSPRETEVLELVSIHLSNPEIAERLYISVRTVESHIASLVRKLGVADRRALVAYATEANRPAIGGPNMRPRTNLPAARSSFIGREAEREQLQQMVNAEALVTLTGIGGCGKTRLALEVASTIEQDFDDGVFFIDLSAVSDPTMVGQAVAGALGLQMLDPTPDALAHYFAERQTLLVFDNCEHMLDACAEMADTLVGKPCPGLRIFATSREALGLEGERVFRVPSLDIAGEAVALFVERAKGARPDLPINSRNEATMAEICRRLDGIPLAIELAATRAAHLSLGEILERLNDRFRLLVGGRRRIQRQQTLTAALDWSYDLLGPEEQLLLRRLAVFRGSFSLPAAEAICHPKAMELLGSLVAKSLVSVTDEGDEVRYRLLETVRIYAEATLAETGESEQLRSVHRDFYLEWVESLPLDQVRSGSALGASRLVLEADNLTPALEWCRQQGRYDLCARIAVRMVSYWYVFVRLSEMRAWWRDLDVGLAAEDRDHRAMALLVRSRAALLAGEWEQANACGEQACALADPHSWVASDARYVQAIYWSMIDPSRSDRLFERSFELDASMGLSPNGLAYAVFYESRLLRAHRQEEAVALLDAWLAELGDGTPTYHMVSVFAFYGEIGRALELKSRLPPARVPMGQVTAELCEATLASTQGQFEEAEQHLSTAVSVVRDFAVFGGEASCLLAFAKFALDRGDYAGASRLLASVKASAGPKDRPFDGPIEALAYNHCTGALQGVLDPETARTTQAEGAALSLKEALDAELSRNTTTRG
jgi:predicted ATPase/DNA-binding CsgD family transcriptional regulator